MTAIDLQLVNGEALTLQVSKNNLDWVNVNPESTDLPNARYVRLINKTDAPVTFEITKFLVTVNAGDAAFEASVPEMSGYAPQNMFDSNLTTAYKPDTTEAGYITYTLSENLDVTKMNIIQKDANSNAKVLVLGLFLDTCKVRASPFTNCKSIAVNSLIPNNVTPIYSSGFNVTASTVGKIEALSASITVAIFFKLSLFVSTNVSFGLLTLKSDIFNQTFLSLVFLTLT